MLYPGEIVTLTCETRATDKQTWIFIDSSDLSNQLQIIITNTSDVMWLNKTVLGGITANVILEENYVKNGFRVLKAVFNTTVLETTGHNRRNLSMTCINDELGTNTTIVMEVAGIYIIQSNFSAYLST